MFVFEKRIGLCHFFSPCQNIYKVIKVCWKVKLLQALSRGMIAMNPIEFPTGSKCRCADRQNSLSLRHLAVLTLHAIKNLYRSPINDSLQPYLPGTPGSPFDVFINNSRVLSMKTGG